jgi:hypothetical protein
MSGSVRAARSAGNHAARSAATISRPIATAIAADNRAMDPADRSRRPDVEGAAAEACQAGEDVALCGKGAHHRVGKADGEVATRAPRCVKFTDNVELRSDWAVRYSPRSNSQIEREARVAW